MPRLCRLNPFLYPRLYLLLATSGFSVPLDSAMQKDVNTGLVCDQRNTPQSSPLTRVVLALQVVGTLCFELWSHSFALATRLDARPHAHGDALVTACVWDTNVAFPQNWTLNARLSYPLASACVYFPFSSPGASRP